MGLIIKNARIYENRKLSGKKSILIEENEIFKRAATLFYEGCRPSLASLIILIPRDRRFHPPPSP